MKKTLFSLLVLLSQPLLAAKPSVFIVCALKGDKFDLSCNSAEERFRSAGYDVYRVDGPDFRNRRPFEQALKTAEKPLVYLTGHGGVSPTGSHKLYLGADGNKRFYPTSLMLNEIERLNSAAQVLVESCQSGQLRDQPNPPGICYGTSCLPDEFSPVALSSKDGKLTSVEGEMLKPVLNLLNMPARDFKKWSGGKCEIGGEELQAYLQYVFPSTKTELTCTVKGYENGERRTAKAIRNDEATCEKKVDELKGEKSLNVNAIAKYEFEVKCADFKPEQTLRIYNSVLSREALNAQLRRKRPNGAAAPTPVKTTEGDTYMSSDLAGLGCEPVPGFYAKHYVAQVAFQAQRNGKQSLVYGDYLDTQKVRDAIMPFVDRWNKDRPAGQPATPKTRGSVGVGVLPEPDSDDPNATKPESVREPPKVRGFRGVATPDFGPLVFRHANCTEGEERRNPIRGSGLWLLEHGLLEQP